MTRREVSCTDLARDPDVLALSEVVALALIVSSRVHKVTRALDLLALRGLRLRTAGVDTAGTGRDDLALGELPRARAISLANTARTNILVTSKREMRTERR